MCEFFARHPQLLKCISLHVTPRVTFYTSLNEVYFFIKKIKIPFALYIFILLRDILPKFFSLPPNIQITSSIYYHIHNFKYMCIYV